MDLKESGKLLCELRKAKGLTQKQLADKLGVVPKTVSKWETGNGLPDALTVPALAEILGVSEKTILSGKITVNKKESGNLKKTSFYVCPHCHSIMSGIGKSRIVCCGKTLSPLSAKAADNMHTIKVSEVENDFYIEFNHEMTKEHYILFAAYVGYDRTLIIRLYPEQSPYIRFPKMYRGKLYFYCNNHGLFEEKL